MSKRPRPALPKPLSEDLVAELRSSADQPASLDAAAKKLRLALNTSEPHNVLSIAHKLLNAYLGNVRGLSRVLTGNILSCRSQLQIFQTKFVQFRQLFLQTSGGVLINTNFKLALPSESLLCIFKFLSRDELDIAQLVCRTFDRIISENECKPLTLRSIKKATIGKTYKSVFSPDKNAQILS